LTAFTTVSKSEEEQKQQQPQTRHEEQQEQPRRIYGVTYGIKSKKTAVVYQRCFKRFLQHIKIHDLEVLLDLNQKVIKEMIIG
jgi:hypothetical protein